MPYFDFGGARNVNGTPFFRRIAHDTESEQDFIRTKRKEYRNTDIYRSIFNYETDDLDKSRIVGPFFLDFDLDGLNEQNYRTLKMQVSHAGLLLKDIFGIDEEYQELYFSGSKGFHVLLAPEIFGFDFEDSTIVIEQYKALAGLIARSIRKNLPYEPLIDMKIYDKRRVFRIVNSKNSKSGLYKIYLTHDELRSLSLGDFKELAKAPREVEILFPPFLPIARQRWDILMSENESEVNEGRRDIRKREGKNFRKGSVMPCIKELLKHGVDKGSRNNTTVALASALLQSGLDKDEAYDVLLDWNEQNNPPLSDSEIMHTLMSANGMIENNRRYGCSSIKTLELCVPHLCKYAKRGTL